MKKIIQIINCCAIAILYIIISVAIINILYAIGFQILLQIIKVFYDSNIEDFPLFLFSLPMFLCGCVAFIGIFAIILEIPIMKKLSKYFTYQLNL